MDRHESSKATASVVHERGIMAAPPKNPPCLINFFLQRVVQSSCQS
jgi:hypothetical protein